MLNFSSYIRAALIFSSLFTILNTATINQGMCDMKEGKSGLKYEDTAEGKGKEAITGKTVSVHYTGWLDNAGKKGTQFDSSVSRGEAFDFPLGAGMVIKGWDDGVAGMKVGGKRTLHIPSALGYGARGAGGAIPPNANPIFDVELLDVK